MEMSTALQERCDQCSASGNHMFAVVEHKQELFRLKRFDEGCQADTYTQILNLAYLSRGAGDFVP